MDIEKLRYFATQITIRLGRPGEAGKISLADAESCLLLAECLVSALHASLYTMRKEGSDDQQR